MFRLRNTVLTGPQVGTSQGTSPVSLPALTRRTEKHDPNDTFGADHETRRSPTCLTTSPTKTTPFHGRALNLQNTLHHPWTPATRTDDAPYALSTLVGLSATPLDPPTSRYTLNTSAPA